MRRQQLGFAWLGVAGLGEAGLGKANTRGIGNGGAQLGLANNDNNNATERQNMESEQNQNTTEVIRLPLWRSCLDEIRENGVEYGQTFTADYFEKWLRCKRDTMTFGLGVSEIRRELEEDGFYLSGRGQKGNQFVIVPPSSNINVMRAREREAITALKRGVILGTNTQMDLLSPSERRRHEQACERMGTKAALLHRHRAVSKTLVEAGFALTQKASGE